MYEWFDREFADNRNDSLIRWGNGRFLLVKVAYQKKIAENLFYKLLNWKNYFKENYNISLAIGVGKTIEKQYISRSYHEAKKALNVAVKDSSILFYDYLLFDIILEEVTATTKDEFKLRVLSLIHREKELIETLRIYLKNDQSLKKSATDLHVHINTLHYRLNQIKNMTGIDPKSSKGIALFYVALELMKKS